MSAPTYTPLTIEELSEIKLDFPVSLCSRCGKLVYDTSAHDQRHGAKA